MLFLCFLYLKKVACHIKIQGSSVYMIAIVRDAFFCELCGWLASPALLQKMMVMGVCAYSRSLGRYNRRGAERCKMPTLLPLQKPPLITGWRKTRCSQDTAETMSPWAREGKAGWRWGCHFWEPCCWAVTRLKACAPAPTWACVRVSGHTHTE